MAHKHTRFKQIPEAGPLPKVESDRTRTSFTWISTEGPELDPTQRSEPTQMRRGALTFKYI